MSSLPDAGPVTGAERIAAVDVLRGFALLGILAMNIQSFAMIEAALFIPAAYGDLTGVNLAVWWAGDLLASRKMMTLFSLLFGAGVLLQDERARAAGRSLRGLWYRRMFWLWVIGMIHVYVFWIGDILVTYAVAGLLLYPLRRLRPGWLLTLGLLALVICSGLWLLSGWSTPNWPEATLAELRADWRPDAAAVAEQTAHVTGSWLGEITHRAPEALQMHLMVIPFYLFWRALGVMLLGMALWKWGLIQQRRPRAWAAWMVAGLVVGLPLTAWGALRQFASGWEPVQAFFIDSQFGYWGSLAVALGWAGLVLTAVDRRWLPGLQARLAAVGRTALSNYLLQTLLCTTIFYGRGLGLFGQVERWGQALIVLAVWALQLWLTPLWLRRFRFGPVEWLWRGLSYRAWPALRR